jgi:hypothetical protein
LGVTAPVADSAAGVSVDAIERPVFGGGGGTYGGGVIAGWDRPAPAALEIGRDVVEPAAVHSHVYLSAPADLHLQSRAAGVWLKAKRAHNRRVAMTCLLMAVHLPWGAWPNSDEVAGQYPTPFLDEPADWQNVQSESKIDANQMNRLLIGAEVLAFDYQSFPPAFKDFNAMVGYEICKHLPLIQSRK